MQLHCDGFHYNFFGICMVLISSILLKFYSRRFFPSFCSYLKYIYYMQMYFILIAILLLSFISFIFFIFFYFFFSFGNESTKCMLRNICVTKFLYILKDNSCSLKQTREKNGFFSKRLFISLIFSNSQFWALSCALFP